MIDPRDKAVIDAYVDVTERERSRRAWRFWLVVAILSFAALCSVVFEFLPFAVRVVLTVAGGIGLLFFLVFLSTKSFGRGYYAGPQWWP